MNEIYAFLSAMFRWWQVIMLCLVASLATGIVAVVTAPAVYRSHALLYVDAGVIDPLMMKDLGGENVDLLKGGLVKVSAKASLPSVALKGVENTLEQLLQKVGVVVADPQLRVDAAAKAVADNTDLYAEAETEEQRSLVLTTLVASMEEKQAAETWQRRVSNSIRLISPAVQAELPESKRIGRAIGVGVVVGLVTGMVTAWCLEEWRRWRKGSSVPPQGCLKQG